MREIKGESDYTEFVGELLKRYNFFEDKVNSLIKDYFAPSKNIKSFQNILLNSSVLGMGQKTKILANMIDFEKEKVEKLRKLMGIRNGIAHNNAFVSIKILDDEKGDIQKIESNNKIMIMNSSGKIVAKDFDMEYKEFEKLMTDLSIYINVYRSAHNL